jgi:3-oxoacyl-[acyl-carrier protein] reductase
MDLGMRGKVAIVCASSRGIGRAAAEALAAEGVQVTLCSRNEAALQSTAEVIRQRSGANVLTVAADLSREQQVHNVFERTLERYGQVDILINNTGGPPPGRFEQHDDAAWQSAFEALLLSVVRLTRLALPGMRARHWGRIVNVTSTSVKQPIANLVLSNALRAAVTGLAKILSQEVASEGITVNCVAPGRILTDRLTSLYGNLEAAREQAGKGVPMGRVGEPADMGSTIAWLCSEQAGYLTGLTVQVDGGLIQSIF